ncbi:unknown protein [Seminavis robusta]|uniref:Uncharacterized protein n=1 Tax=Seminavis robusta TaxID=568900 RepID=A0A9N8EEX7_9STRA|nr:unknown protein [Seminavis robusta]|eukprot:Sro1024_g232590.1 n/a (206) ;mRNA; r:7866-8483
MQTSTTLLLALAAIQPFCASSVTAGSSQDLTFDDIIGDFSRSISTRISNVLRHSADPVSLQDVEFIQQIPSVAFDENCTDAGTVIYRFGSLTGLGTFELSNMIIVSDDSVISSVPFSGFDWEGTFLADGVLPNGLEVFIEVELSGDACGEGVHQTISGFLVSFSPTRLSIDLQASGNSKEVAFSDEISNRVREVQVNEQNYLWTH